MEYLLSLDFKTKLFMISSIYVELENKKGHIKNEILKRSNNP